MHNIYWYDQGLMVSPAYILRPCLAEGLLCLHVPNSFNACFFFLQLITQQIQGQQCSIIEINSAQYPFLFLLNASTFGTSSADQPCFLKKTKNKKKRICTSKYQYEHKFHLFANQMNRIGSLFDFHARDQRGPLLTLALFNCDHNLSFTSIIMCLCCVTVTVPWLHFIWQNHTTVPMCSSKLCHWI